MSQQSFIISDGSNDVAVLNTTPGGTEYALAVRIIGAAAGGTNSLFTSAFPSAGTAAGFTDGTNMQGARVFDLDSGGGTEYVLGTNLRFVSSGGSVEAGTNSNPLRIDPTGTTTQPISGTVTANAGSGTFTIAGTVTANQGGTWTVQPGNTQNTTPWLTQDSADGPVTPGAVASNSILLGGQYNTGLPTLTNTQQAAIQVDSNGRLLVGSIASALPTGSNVIGAVTQSGTWTVAQGTPAALSNKWPVQHTDGTNSMPTGDVVGRAIFHKITDGTNTATVKAASTAAVAADQALVVAVSPNNIVSVVLPTKATFSAVATLVQLGNNKSMISLANATGSTVVIRIEEIWVENVQTTSVTGTQARFELKRFTSHSAGTSITPEAYDSTSAIDGYVSVKTNATISGESSVALMRKLYSTDEWGPGTLDEEGLEHAIQIHTPFWFRRDLEGQLVVLRANEGVHIKCTTNTTNGTFDMTMVFTQAAA